MRTKERTFLARTQSHNATERCELVFKAESTHCPCCLGLESYQLKTPWSRKDKYSIPRSPTQSLHNCTKATQIQRLRWLATASEQQTAMETLENQSASVKKTDASWCTQGCASFCEVFAFLLLQL